MNSITNIMNNYKNSTGKQKAVFLGIIIVSLITIILIITLIASVVGSRISYENLEKKLVDSTERYMDDNPNNLPTESNPVVVINDTMLIEGKYLKKLKSYVKDSSCSAIINVHYEEGKYIYTPFLTCNDFKTEKLSDVLKNNNKLSSFGEGLYEMNNEFVYRGENPNNYLKFADEIWRIVKINNEGKIMIIKEELETENYGVWDDRYNTEAETQKGNNNFSVSRALSTIKQTFQKKYDKHLNSLTTYTLCIGKRNDLDTSKDGSIECSSPLENQYIGLLPLYDYMNASLDSICLNANSKECQNYNYLTNDKDKWWTLTGDTKTTYNVYFINYTGQIESDEADINANYRYVLALDKNILYKKGTGTLEDPYEIR